MGMYFLQFKSETLEETLREYEENSGTYLDGDTLTGARQCAEMYPDKAWRIVKVKRVGDEPKIASVHSLKKSK